MRILFKIFALFLLCTAGTVIADTPSRIQTSYTIFKAGLRIGQIEETYQQDNGRYTLVSITQAVGIFAWFKSGRIIVRSSGLIDDSGLKPLSFSAVHEDSINDGRYAILDWDNKKLFLMHQTDQKELELPDNTQDRLSAMYQFMFLPLKSSKLAFSMINGGYLLKFNFDISDGPLLETPAGEFSTLYIDNKSQGAKERTEIWLAKERYHLPCKMIITDDGGSKITQLLNQISVIP